MVQAAVKSSYYLKVTAADAGSVVDRLSTGSRELFISKLGVMKNFEAKVVVIGRKGEEMPPTGVKVHLHASNPHVSL